MNFIDKQLAIKLKEKGFDKPCFGWYYINIPAGRAEDELILNTSNTRGVAYEDLLHSHNEVLAYYPADRCVDAPTIEQALEWLREEKEIDIVIYPIDRNTIYMGGEKYILSIYFCGKRDYKIHKDNNDKFVKWKDACIAGIEYAVDNLI